MRERHPCVYILASGYNGTLYVGVTSNLIGRLIQHREGTFDGFTKRYTILRLVYYEVADTMEAPSTARSSSKNTAETGSATSSNARTRHGTT